MQTSCIVVLYWCASYQPNEAWATRSQCPDVPVDSKGSETCCTFSVHLTDRGWWSLSGMRLPRDMFWQIYQGLKDSRSCNPVFNTTSFLIRCYPANYKGAWKTSPKRFILSWGAFFDINKLFPSELWNHTRLNHQSPTAIIVKLANYPILTESRTIVSTNVSGRHQSDLHLKHSLLLAWFLSWNLPFALFLLLPPVKPPPILVASPC